MGMAQFLKRFLLILVILAGSFRIGAQDPGYYIYLQSERSQPFYVRYDGKLLSSSDKGYLIISKLHAGTASLRIGFANNGGPEQQFLIRLSGNNDQGYLIKKDGDNGYALYNLQTFASIKPNTGKEVHKEPVAVVAKDTPVAVATTESAVVPAAVAATPVSTDAKMASLQKDLDSAFTDKSAVTVGPGSRPVGPIVAPPVAAAPIAATPAPVAVVKQPNKFSQALDKVVGDDRVEEVVPVDDPPVVDSVVATPEPVEAPVKKGRRKRRDREVLTPEEQQIAADVLAEERLAAAKDTTVATAVVAEEVVEKKVKKHKKTENDPAFINFEEDGTKAAALPVVVHPEVAAPITPVVTEEVPAPKKKKKRKSASEDVATVVADTSTGYALSDLSIDHPKESKKDRKKKKEAEEAAAMPVAAPAVVAEAPVPAVTTEEKSSSLKMINSDCGNVLDETNFRKVLRKFVAGKDDDGMIDVFKKQTKGYCLETSQMKTLVQLLNSNEARYRLLDLGYPKVSDSGKYSSLESVLTDDYYKGRFRAMLHK
jgi:hypothetical protein